MNKKVPPTQTDYLASVFSFVIESVTGKTVPYKLCKRLARNTLKELKRYPQDMPENKNQTQQRSRQMEFRKTQWLIVAVVVAIVGAVLGGWI